MAALSREYYACLLGKHQILGGLHIITVSDIYYPDESYYNQQGVAALRVSGDFLRERLIELSQRIDVDTMIDVHTHPFSTGNVWFSGTDDRDEINFTTYLRDEIEAEIFYASIVLSQTDYKARFWSLDNGGRAVQTPAMIKTQKLSEAIPSSDGFGKKIVRIRLTTRCLIGACGRSGSTPCALSPAGK